jgi:hypothetical protein
MDNEESDEDIEEADYWKGIEGHDYNEVMKDY